MLMKVRPYIKLFDSQQYLNALPNGDRCLAMTWSGDYAVAATRAEEAGLEINLAYTMPEGRQQHLVRRDADPEGRAEPGERASCS